MPPGAEEGVLPLLTRLGSLAENFFLFSLMVSVTLSFAFFFFFLILFCVHMFMSVCVWLAVHHGTPKWGQRTTVGASSLLEPCRSL